MIEICDKALHKPLHWVFPSCMKSRIDQRDMVNVVLIRKRDKKIKC